MILVPETAAATSVRWDGAGATDRHGPLTFAAGGVAGVVAVVDGGCWLAAGGAGFRVGLDAEQPAAAISAPASTSPTVDLGNRGDREDLRDRMPTVLPHSSQSGR